jgi:Cys-rich protein (TIGR01571 family)
MSQNTAATNLASPTVGAVQPYPSAAVAGQAMVIERNGVRQEVVAPAGYYASTGHQLYQYDGQSRGGSYVQVPLFTTGPKWSSELCSCTNHCGSCLDAWCCFPCQVGYQYGYLATGHRNCSGYDCLMASCCPQISVANLRGLVRRAFGIDGHGCKDCMSAFCCTPCVVAQNYREFSLRGHWTGGVLACSPYVRYQTITHLPAPLAPMGAGMSDAAHQSNVVVGTVNAPTYNGAYAPPAPVPVQPTPTTPLLKRAAGEQ